MTLGDCCYIGSQTVIARGVQVGHRYALLAPVRQNPLAESRQLLEESLAAVRAAAHADPG